MPYLQRSGRIEPDIVCNLALHVNAAADDGSEMAKLMQYFKTADPNNMEYGELSKRVHYLKCEEREYKEMCEVSEKIYREGEIEGRKEGEMNKAR